MEFSTGADGVSLGEKSEATFDEFPIADTVQLERSIALQDANRRNGRRQSMAQHVQDRSVPSAETPPPRRSARTPAGN